ncbi:TetR/AcrR family transcriptional regulator [Kribbella italica]|uniref:AcrR family transcriptional regulator n=1 Tax=Kribbella italica TaxID=1540520 RepID=A0A7W9MYV8_9ACTN|nr:TetR/AcrR family transcriptional regulator [Kribbella italica]MBB5841229.1 AcrR family transcriptional regulator [Kribbella italica]
MEIGRRERKKQQTRQVISDVATRLFLERGFDAVTVAEVAKAADVAVQTVFNHFPTKEDLFFDETGWWAGPAEAIRNAPPGQNPIDTLEQQYLTVVRGRLESGHLETWREFSRTMAESQALLARRRQIAEEMERTLAAALQERDPELAPLTARFVAAQFAAAQKVLEAELALIMPPDATPEQLKASNAQLEQATVEVFDALRRAG